MPELRLLDRSHVDGAADLLGRALAPNPMWSTLLAHLSSSARVDAVVKLHRGVVRATLDDGEALGAFVDGELAGVSLALPPDRYPFRPRAFLRVAWATLQWPLLRVIPRMVRVDSWRNRHLPTSPHRHLISIGVAEKRQGHGLGGALLTRFGATCDLQRLPAYVETNKPDNLPFYRRHGFVVVFEETLSVGGQPLTLWGLRRPPPPNPSDVSAS